jgi:hypothetical protein
MESGTKCWGCGSPFDATLAALGSRPQTRCADCIAEQKLRRSVFADKKVACSSPGCHNFFFLSSVVQKRCACLHTALPILCRVCRLAAELVARIQEIPEEL